MFLPIDSANLATLLATEITNSVRRNNAYTGSQTKTLLTTLQTAPYPAGVAVKASLASLPLSEKVTYFRLHKFVREFYPGVDEDIAGRVTYRGFNFRTNGTNLLNRAKEAWALMARLTTTMKRYLNYVHDPDIVSRSGFQSKSQTTEEKWAVDLFIKWFDKKLKFNNIAEVKRIVANLNRAVTAEDFEIICEGDPVDPNGVCHPDPIAPGEFGEVHQEDGRNRFYIGPVFFNMLSQNIGGTCSLSVAPKMGQTYSQTKTAIFTALNASTITMLHELTHIVAIGNTDDVGGDDAYDADLCMDKARNNPADAIRNAENYALYAKDVLNVLQFSPPPGKL